LLAVDRNNERVSTPYDSFHPAVLNAVLEVLRRARPSGKPVSVCGELAGDPAGALVLLGAGVDALSMSASSVSRVKRAIRSFTATQARALLQTALEEAEGAAVHHLLNAALEEAGVPEIAERDVN
jgi:phosphotransferase system enzyme I (PtsP)